jgi:hypothetical protein
MELDKVFLFPYTALFQREGVWARQARESRYVFSRKGGRNRTTHRPKTRVPAAQPGMALARAPHAGSALVVAPGAVAHGVRPARMWGWRGKLREMVDRWAVGYNSVVLKMACSQSHCKIQAPFPATPSKFQPTLELRSSLAVLYC